MTRHCVLSLLCLLFAWAPSSLGFTVTPPAQGVTAVQGGCSASLFGCVQRAPVRWRRHMAEEQTPDENKSAEDAPITASGDLKDKSQAIQSQDETNEGGMWKTVLLAGPLFVKFVVILLIKFMTDLIVFPLLWLYRLARLTKKSVMKLFGAGPEPPNGAAA